MAERESRQGKSVAIQGGGLTGKTDADGGHVEPLVTAEMWRYTEALSSRRQPGEEDPFDAISPQSLARLRNNYIGHDADQISDLELVKYSVGVLRREADEDRKRLETLERHDLNPIGVNIGDPDTRHALVLLSNMDGFIETAEQNIIHQKREIAKERGKIRRNTRQQRALVKAIIGGPSRLRSALVRIQNAKR